MAELLSAMIRQLFPVFAGQKKGLQMCRPSRSSIEKIHGLQVHPALPERADVYVLVIVVLVFHDFYYIDSA